MKSLHIFSDRGKWWINFMLVRFDIKKIMKTGKLDVLFGIGAGWSLPANKFTRKKRFYFKLDFPKFNVKECSYRSPIYFELG